MPSCSPLCGDLIAFNTHRDLLDTIGRELLADIAWGCLALLESSVTIHEVNGDYATALCVSEYCQLLAEASRRRCDTDDDRAALDSGWWHCHEAHWSEAARIAVETGQPFDLRPGRCGIGIYAVPIVAEGQTIGAISLGCGLPPTDPVTLTEVAAGHGADLAVLRRAAEAHPPHPEAVIEAAKRHLHAAADLIAKVYLRHKGSPSAQQFATGAELMQRVHEAFSQGATLDKVLWMVVEGTRALFDGQMASIYFLSDDRRHLLIQNWPLPDRLTRSLEKLTGLDVRHVPLPLVEGGYYWRVVEERETFLLDQPEQIKSLLAELAAKFSVLKRFVPLIARLLGHRTVLITPLVAGDEVVGVMDLGSRHRLGEEDRRRFQLLAAQMGLVIERARLFEEVSALKEFNERVLGSIQQGVAVLDTEGRIRYLNEFIKTHYGWSDELIGQDVFKYRPVYRQVGMYDAFRRVVDTGEPVEGLHVSHPDHTGRQLTRDFYAYPLREEGRLTGVVVVVNDVTAEYRLEEKLAAIHELGRELVLTRDEDRIIETVLDAAERLLAFQFVAFMRVNEERNALCVVARRGFSVEMDSLCLPLDGERGITVAAARSGQPIYLPDVTQDARYVESHTESRSELVVPLKVGGRVIGVLNVESEEFDAFTEADQRLLSTLADQAALAIENARLYDETRRRLAREEWLTELAHTLGSELELATLIPRLLPPMIELTGADAATVAILDPDRELIVYPYNFNLPGALDGVKAPMGTGLAGYTMEARRPVLLDDYREHPAALPTWVEAGVRSVLTVPLLVGEEVVGSMGLFSLGEVRPFGPEAVVAAEAAARLAAVAIQRARLFEAEQRRRREAETLRQAALTLSTTLDQQEVFELILSQLQQVVPYDSASVQLLRGDRLEIIGGRGFPSLPELLHMSFPVDGNNPNREVVRTRAPFILDDAPAVYDTFRQEPLVRMKIRSWLGVPMLIGERLIGMITIDKYEPGFYTEEHARLAQGFAAQAAIAIENARLFGAAQHEIAERKQAEESLRESEEKYRTILDDIEEGYFEVDVAGNFIFFNDSLCGILGYSRDEMMGMNNRQYMDARNAKKVFQMFNRVYTTGKAIRGFDCEIVRKDGTKRFIETSVSLIKDSEGKPVGFRGIARDITERKQMQARLMQAEKLAAVGELVAGVAHELNNPLTAVVGYAQLLQRQPVVEEGVKHKLSVIFQ